MKRGTMIVLAVLSLTVFLAGGCANKEAVKSEEPVVKAEPSRTPGAPNANCPPGRPCRTRLSPRPRLPSRSSRQKPRGCHGSCPGDRF